MNITKEQKKKNREELIASVSEAVALDWYRRAIRNPVRMYLFWRKPVQGERVACPVIDTSAPNEAFHSHETPVSPAWNRPKVQAFVAEAMRSLPMWHTEEFL